MENKIQKKGTKDMIEDEILKQLSEKYDKRKVYIKFLIKICKDLKVLNIKETIEKYLKNTNFC